MFKNYLSHGGGFFQATVTEWVAMRESKRIIPTAIILNPERIANKSVFPIDARQFNPLQWHSGNKDQEMYRIKLKYYKLQDETNWFLRAIRRKGLDVTTSLFIFIKLAWTSRATFSSAGPDSIGVNPDPDKTEWL